MNRPVRITFTSSELCREYENAELIVDEATDRGAKPNWAYKNLSEQIGATFIGRLGELALAKHLNLNLELTGYDRYAYDVGDQYEVRTRRRDNYDLFTFTTDKDAIYVLATCTPDYTVKLRGWIPLSEANVPAHYTERFSRPCYLTPQTALYPMIDLPVKETRPNGI